jgi:hypothetical protein
MGCAGAGKVIPCNSQTSGSNWVMGFKYGSGRPLWDSPLRYPILGLCGCLQFFDARFLEEKRFVELETNPSFPGTTS